MTTRRSLPANLPPGAICVELAAEFCGVSMPLFERECPVAPKWIGGRKVWSVSKLRRWLDDGDSAAHQGPTADEIIDGLP